MKRLIKRAIQSATAAAAPLLWRVDPQIKLLILMYHRVLPYGHPDRLTEQPGMYVSPETLAMHMRVVKENFALVHLDDWITKVQAGHSVPSSACAVTFDDGWRDNYQYAFPVLQQAMAPATIYLVAQLVGTHYQFWPNRLMKFLAHVEKLPSPLPAWMAVWLQQNSFDHQGIEAFIEHCKDQYTDAQMEAQLDELDRLQHPNAGQGYTQGRNLMDWDEIRIMEQSGLIRFGSHSQRHTRLLKNLPIEIVRDEIVTSLATIEKNLGKRPTTFCYPNGDFSPAAVEIVRSHYMAAVTTRRGWNSKASEPFLLKRVGVHDDVSNTPASFLARLAGVG